MRLLQAVAALALSGPPALANTIVQELRATETGINDDDGSFPIYGALFNPALGTITAATATLTGIYCPSVIDPDGPLTTTITSNFTLVAAGQGFGSPLGSQTVTPVAGIYQGELSSIPSQNFEFASPGRFTSSFGPPWLPPIVGDFYVGSTLRDGGAMTERTWADVVFTLTYTYQVPEPGSLLLLGGGILLLFGCLGSLPCVDAPEEVSRTWGF